MDELLKLGQSITQSPDFNPRRVGVWKRLFATPDCDRNATPEEYDELVRERLRIFLTKAFRQPPDTELLDRYADFAIESIVGGTIIRKR
ncbi:MAG: hypothetical protein R3C05_10295 [Pirellulaceae bacterium]